MAKDDIYNQKVLVYFRGQKNKHQSFTMSENLPQLNQCQHANPEFCLPSLQGHNNSMWMGQVMFIRKLHWHNTSC